MSKKQEKPYPDFPLTPRVDGRWQKRFKGKLYAFSGNWKEALEQWAVAKRNLEVGFPLTKHVDGRWKKNIRGKRYYFSGTPEEAFLKYKKLLESLGPDTNRTTDVKSWLDHYLSHKLDDVAAGKITRKHYRDLRSDCRRMVQFLGKSTLVSNVNQSSISGLFVSLGRSSDGRELSKATVRSRIARCKSAITFAIKSRWMPPVEFSLCEPGELKHTCPVCGSPFSDAVLYRKKRICSNGCKENLKCHAKRAQEIEKELELSDKERQVRALRVAEEARKEIARLLRPLSLAAKQSLKKELETLEPFLK